MNHLTGQIEPVCRARARGCEVIVTQLTNVAPTRFDPVIIHTVRQHASQLGLQHLDILSGAGHDAMYMASVCPSGMIFIPCTKGVSHNEAENARPEDVVAGARMLAACVVDLANR